LNSNPDCNPDYRLKSILVILFSLLLLSPGLFAQASSNIEEPVEIVPIRMAAMGGTHVALSDDLSTLLSNPAGFRRAGPELSISKLNLGLSGPIFDIASVIIESSGAGSPADILLSSNVQDLLKSLYASMNILGPLAFGFVGKGLGFGFFSNSKLEFSSAGSIPSIDAGIEQDFLFSGGYAFRIPLPESWNSTLDIGALLKSFVRGTIGISSSMLDLIGLFQSPSLDIIYSQPFTLGIGIGVDSGLLYNWKDLFSFGIVARNLYAPTLDNEYSSFNDFLSSASPTVTYGIVPIDLSAGLMIAPNLGPLERYISKLKVFLDYGDILDFLTHPATAKNPVLHIGIGTEVILLDILYIRGGFHEGLFSAGLGVDLTFFTLNLSMFGSELSTEPGLRPVYNLMLGLDFTL